MVIKFMKLLLIIISACSFIQQNEINEAEVKKELISFLKSEKEIHDNNTGIYLRSLVDYEPFNGNKGIFKFGVLGSHHLEYIVFINDNNLDIITNYDVTSILPRLNQWVQQSELSEREKLTLLRNVSTLLVRRYEAISTIPEEIEY
jgi:hypothetical protein